MAYFLLPVAASQIGCCFPRVAGTQVYFTLVIFSLLPLPPQYNPLSHLIHRMSLSQQSGDLCRNGASFLTIHVRQCSWNRNVLLTTPGHPYWPPLGTRNYGACHTISQPPTSLPCSPFNQSLEMFVGACCARMPIVFPVVATNPWYLGDLPGFAQIYPWSC